MAPAVTPHFLLLPGQLAMKQDELATTFVFRFLELQTGHKRHDSNSSGQAIMFRHNLQTTVLTSKVTRLPW